jgi:hypothetical protein
MLGLFKFPVFAFAGVMTAMSYQAIDIKLNYRLTPAVILAVETQCFVERSHKERVVQKGTKDRAYMECAEAPSVAKRHGFGEQDIRTRTKVEYSYKSPIDSKMYAGRLERTDMARSLTVGKQIYVYASDNVPADSRTTKSNIFLGDTGV